MSLQFNKCNLTNILFLYIKIRYYIKNVNYLLFIIFLFYVNNINYVNYS